MARLPRSTSSQRTSARVIPRTNDYQLVDGIVYSADEIMASATRLSDLRGDGALRKRARTIEQWQKDAWRLYDTLGEITQYADFYGKSMSSVKFIAADAEGEPLLDVENDARGGDTVQDIPSGEYLTQAEIDEARDVIAMIVGDDGTQGSLTRPLATILAISGDATIVEYPVDERGLPVVEDPSMARTGDQRATLEELGDRVRFAVVPTGHADEVRHTLKLSREGKAKDIHPDALHVRIHNPHPAFPDDPFSPVCSVIDIGDEMMILSRVAANSAMSRAHAGFFKWPSELLPRRKGTESGEPELNPDGSPRRAPTAQIEKLFDAWLNAAEDPTSFDIVLPGVITGRMEFLAGIEHVQPDRLIDPEIRESVTDRQKRLSQGLDLPPEVILGIADTKAWNAWKVDEDTWKSHLKPMAVLIADGWTDGIYWPELQARGWTEDRIKLVRVGFDVTELVIKTDMGEAASNAHDRMTISDAAYRRHTGFEESDAPDEEEVVLRLERIRLQKARSVDSAAPGDSSRASNGPGTDGPEDSVLASAAPRRLDDLQRELLAIDRDFRSQLEQVVESALERAVEKRGNQVRSLALRHRKSTLGETVKTLCPEAVLIHVGPKQTAEILALANGELGDEELLTGLMFERFRKLAQAALNRIKSKYAALGTTMSETEAATYAANVEKAWVRLLKESVNALATKMFGGGAELGEASTVSREATAAARNAAASMGGQGAEAVVQNVNAEPMAPGPALGPDGLENLERRGVQATDEWEWVYGDAGARSAPFRPHQELDSGDGTTYSGPNDIGLAILGPFPRGSHYRPGDHAGCQCDFVRVLVAVNQ